MYKTGEEVQWFVPGWWFESDPGHWWSTKVSGECCWSSANAKNHLEPMPTGSLSRMFGKLCIRVIKWGAAHCSEVSGTISMNSLPLPSRTWYLNPSFLRFLSLAIRLLKLWNSTWNLSIFNKKKEFVPNYTMDACHIMDRSQTTSAKICWAFKPPVLPSGNHKCK